MDYVNNYIALELCSETGNAYIPVRKGENMRKLCISLKNNGEPYAIGSGVTAKIAGTYPSGTTFLQNATVDNNMVKYVLTSTDTASVGEIKCEVRLTGSNSESIISPTFTIKVFDVSGAS